MSRFERLLMHLSTAIVGASGAAYAIMKYAMDSVDPYAVINHPLQPWALDVHVLAGPFLVFAVGLIARDHILAQMAKGRARLGARSGLFAVVCLAPMIATGYLIQVVTGETARAALVAAHLATGGLYAIAFAAHLTASRRLAARKRLADRSAAASPAVLWERAARESQRAPGQALGGRV